MAAEMNSPPPTELVVKKMIVPFSLSALDGYLPWAILTTKAVAQVFGTNPLALGMRIYRGAGPKPVPKDWIKGHVAGFMVADLRAWLGDPRDETEMYREAVGAPDETNDAVRLYARARAQNEEAIIGGQFTNKGRASYLNYIYAL